MVKKLIVHGSFVSKLLVPVLVGVFLFAPFQAQVATSQTAAQQTAPGMPFIAQTAINAPTLEQILTGQIPATIPQYLTLPDPTGQISTYQPLAPLGGTQTSTNAFFSTAITKNQRTCFTCHQPQNDWGITPPQILAELITTGGKSALFQPIDARNCPTGATEKYPDPRFFLERSQLLMRGNFRIALNAPNPWGPKDSSYTTFNGSKNVTTPPEWVLTVDYDPYGCEWDTTYGLPNNQISVYRRPLNSANVAFLNRFDSVVEGPNGPPVPSPNQEKLDIMWDAREPNLGTQFIDATMFHGQTTVEPPDDAIAQGIQFQSGMFTAQTYDNLAGDLTGNDSSGALGGPMNLYDFYLDLTLTPPFVNPCADSLNEQAGVTVLACGPDFKPAIIPFGPASALYSAFAAPTTNNLIKNARRESIARGEAIFIGKTKQFTIQNVAGLNDIGLGNPINNASCSFCHNNANVLNDGAFDAKRVGIMDNSNESDNGAVVTTMPFTSDFPRFAFYCPTGSVTFFSNTKAWPACQMLPGHPMTCDKFITTDPGLGLITGLCADLGRMKVPILRGVGARAPYFHGGNAATLNDVVNFYNNRFNIGLTAQQKQDLVNYLNSL